MTNHTTREIIIRRLYLIIFILMILTSSGCSFFESLLGLGSVEKPRVSMESIRFSGMTFDAVDMIFTIKLENPNAIGISASAFDYDFSLNEKTYLSGSQSSGFTISPRETENLDIPVSLHFADIVELMGSLGDRDSTSYSFKANFSFDLPVVGTVNIPLQVSGYVPVLHIPRIAVENFKIDRVSFVGADATVQLRVENPNAFALKTTDFHYEFFINNKPVVSGKNPDAIDVGVKSAGAIEIPVSIDFVDFGQSIYRILRREEPADYQFRGSAAFLSPFEFQGTIPFDFDLSGALSPQSFP